MIRSSTITASLIVLLLFQDIALSEKDAHIEVFEPFSRVLEGERWITFVRVSNTGDAPIELLRSPEDYQFFIEPTVTEVSPHSKQLLPIPRIENASWGLISEAPGDAKLILKPGEFFVYGQEGLGGVTGLYGLSLRRISRYKVHLLIGHNQWVTSEAVSRNYAIREGVWELPPVAEVSLAKPNLSKVPIRIIEIDKIKWAFKGRGRLCIIPDASKPSFSVDSTAEKLIVLFEGAGEQKVVCDNRKSHPILGAKSTVPHLYLWQSLTTRHSGIVGKDFVPEKIPPSVSEDKGIDLSPIKDSGAPTTEDKPASPISVTRISIICAVVVSGILALRRLRSVGSR